MKNIPLLTGTMLSLVFCAVAGTPASANSTSEQFQGQDRSQIAQATPMRGTIRSMTGNVVTVEMEDGKTENIGVSRAQIGQLTPGADVLVQDGRIVEVGPLGQPVRERQMSPMADSGPMKGTIRSITGNIVTVEMENGKTENIGVSRSESIGLVPGTKVMVENGRITDYNPTAEVPQPQPTYTSRVDQVFSELETRTQTTTIPPRVERPQMNPTTPPATVQQPMMPRPEMQEEAQPVRGLW